MLSVRTVAIILWLGFILCLPGSAQVDSTTNNQPKSDCEATLAIATGEFNAGRFFSLPSILQGCMNSGFTKEQKVRAYILLCQVYLINDDPKEAENSYLKLLQADPEYVAKPETDPVDVVYLSNKFTTRPVFTPHIRIGLNTSLNSIIHRSVPFGAEQDLEYSRKPNVGFQVGGGLDWNLSDRISVCGDLTFAQRNFTQAVDKIFNDDRSSTLAKFRWLDVPVYVKYQDTKGKWRPYGYVGYSAHMRLSSRAALTYVNVDPDPDGGPSTEKPTEGPDVVFSKQQNLFNRSLVVGGGIKYKIGKNYLFADLRMMIGLSNVTDENRVLADAEGVFNRNASFYAIAVDLYRINSLNISVGYIFPVYNPRKKGGWQPKGILGKILYGKTTIEE
jgi:hypothetical protein